MPLSSPLLDQYNQDGIVTPGLKRALDMAQARMPKFTDTLAPGGAPTPSPTLSANAPTLSANTPAPTLSHPAAPAPALTNPAASPAPLTATSAAPAPTGHQQEVQRLEGSPSGIAGIHHAAARIPLQILDAIGSTFAPALTSFLPGTELHHAGLVNIARSNVANDEAQQKATDTSRLTNAQAENQEAAPALKQASADLAASKASETATHNRATEDIAHEKETGRQNTTNANRKATLASHGFEENEQGEIVPLSYERMSEQQQAVHDLKGAQSEAAQATAALRKAQAENQPTLVKLAQERLLRAQEAHNIASRRLGLSEKQFEMHAHGTENGEALPGAIIGDDGKPVGTAFQGNVKPTGTQRDAAGRANTMLDLDARIRKALQNPEILKGTGPLAGRLSEIENRVGVLPHDLAELKNDLISYGAFQAGLHPVRGIGALQYFDKVMGGLGQNPEELVGKLDSNKATANSVKKVGDIKATGKTPAGGDDQLPGGISLKDIDAEIARRKGKK